MSSELRNNSVTSTPPVRKALSLFGHNASMLSSSLCVWNEAFGSDPTPRFYAFVETASLISASVDVFARDGQ